MAKANRSINHRGRVEPDISLDALDETEELTPQLATDQSEAGALALELRESGAQLLRLSNMNMMQQATHAPRLMADVVGQIAHALELIELQGRD